MICAETMKTTSLLTVALLLLGARISVDAIDMSQCIAPLGMESGAIPDADITASSSFDSGNVGPHQGRLNQDRNGGAWCPKSTITTDSTEWIEINLHKVHVITATGTQGRFGNSQGVEFSEGYVLEYWRAALGKWVRYRNVRGEEVITGNKNTYLEVKHTLDPPIWASKVRFLPYSYHRRTVCMRVELYGCPWNDGVVSYSMPQGDKRGAKEFFDVTYDGYWNDELRRGLGQLTDGLKGPNNFKTGATGERGEQNWVGWRNDTRENKPLEIKFEFDQVREFSAVHVYCNNQWTKEVQMFSQVNILFSIGGVYYTGDPIVFDNFDDRFLEESRNITIKLHHRIGKFVKLRFGFANRWLMISEITFDSDIAHGNFTPEEAPTTEVPRYRDRGSSREISHQQAEVPVSTAKQEEGTYMAVIIGVMTALILLLAVAMFLILSRHCQRKAFASPLGSKSGLPPGGHHHHLANESAYGTAEKDPALMTYRVDDLDRYAGAKLTTLPRELNDRLLGDVRLDDYQEPFKYREAPHAAYYGYSTVVIDNKDLHDSVEQSDATYDYAVPMPVPSASSDQDSTFSKSSRGSAKACLQSFFPPPPPPMSAPPSRIGANNLTYSGPPSPDLMYERGRGMVGGGSKRGREHSLHRYT